MVKTATKFDGELKEPFTLTQEEVIALYDYFMKRAGYISYEFDPFIIVLIRRLCKEVEKDKKI